MTDKKVDLTALDPSREAERWNRLLDSVATRAWNARRRRLTVSFQVVSWARPALAIAATLALVSWAATYQQDRPGASSSAGSAEVIASKDGAKAGSLSASETAQIGKDQDPTTVLARWAELDEMPPTADILRVLGESHGTD